MVILGQKLDLQEVLEILWRNA